MSRRAVEDVQNQKNKLTFDEMVKYMNTCMGSQPPPVHTDRMAAREAIDYNIYKEYNAIKKFMEKTEQSKYTIARFKILGYMIKCIEADPENGDWYDEDNMKQLKEAGRMLYEEDGMNGMNDTLVWSFVPKRYMREIDMAWNNIGLWRS